MTDDDRDEPPDSEDPNNGVGYGRPPKHSQFRPGESGNPGGRRRGAVSLATELKKLFSRQIPASDGAMVSALQAILLRGLKEALKGDFQWARLFLKEARRLDEADAPNLTDEDALSDEEIIEEFRNRLKSQRSDGNRDPQIP